MRITYRKRDYEGNQRHSHHHHHHKRKMAIWKKILLVVAIIVLLLGILAVGAYAYLHSLVYGTSNYVQNETYTVAESIQQETYLDEDGNVQQETEATLEEEKESEVLAEQEKALADIDDEEETGTYNLLLIGVDRRDTSWYGNSDVMILVTVNHDKQKIFMTSFMRDLYANIPGVGVRKLNASCAYGGAQLCVETIESNYAVQIDNYAMVDFNAMIHVVDALGGVDLEIAEDEIDVTNSYITSMASANGIDGSQYLLTEAGMQHLNGYQAVGYSRNRYSGSTSDFGRTERQRKVLTAIFEKAKDGGLGSLASAAKSVLPYITHDIDSSTLLSLISKAPGWLDYELEEVRVPFDDMWYSQNEILIPTDMSATIQKIRDTIY